MARRRKALAEKNANAEEQDERLVEISRSIDQQVEARAAAIRAICDAQISAFVTQLKLQEASLSDELLDMPIEEFLERYCPNTELVCRETGVVELQKKDATVQQEGHQLLTSFLVQSNLSRAATSNSTKSTFFCTPRVLRSCVQTRSMR